MQYVGCWLGPPELGRITCYVLSQSDPGLSQHGINVGFASFGSKASYLMAMVPDW